MTNPPARRAPEDAALVKTLSELYSLAEMGRSVNVCGKRFAAMFVLNWQDIRLFWAFTRGQITVAPPPSRRRAPGQKEKPDEQTGVPLQRYRGRLC